MWQKKLAGFLWDDYERKELKLVKRGSFKCMYIHQGCVLKKFVHVNTWVMVVTKRQFVHSLSCTHPSLASIKNTYLKKLPVITLPSWTNSRAAFVSSASRINVHKKLSRIRQKKIMIQCVTNCLCKWSSHIEMGNNEHHLFFISDYCITL